jgi:multiple sugar transport system permease protein
MTRRIVQQAPPASRPAALPSARPAVAGPARRRWRRLPFSPWHLVLAPTAAVMLLPLIWVIITSIQRPSDALQFPPVLVPRGLHWQNYPDAWRSAPFGHWFVNSTVVASAAVLGNLTVGALAGYAFARIRFLGRGVLFIVLLATLMVPLQLLIIPTFVIVRLLGLVDTLPALILPNLVTPFSIFLFRQFFRTLPLELEDAARIDGASRLTVLTRVVAPLSTPVLATVAVITFLWTWNDFLWPLVVISSDSQMTLQLGLSSFQGAHSTQWALLMAGTAMSQVPILALFFICQRWFVQSVALSGLK